MENTPLTLEKGLLQNLSQARGLTDHFRYKLAEVRSNWIRATNYAGNTNKIDRQIVRLRKASKLLNLALNELDPQSLTQ